MEYRHTLIQDSQLLIFLQISGHVIGQAVSRWPVTTEDWIQSHPSSCWICGGRSGNGTDFFFKSFSLACQYHSTDGPSLFTDRSLILNNLNNWQCC